MLGAVIDRLAASAARVSAAAALGACAFGLAAATLAPPSAAVSIELKDVAPDRIERQRRAVEGRLPLPGTPDVGLMPQRLAAAGVRAGAPIFMRVFKESSELEVWISKDDRFVLIGTYPICHWSGTLGPKLREGDKQTPEGFYSITNWQMRRLGRWPSAMNLGYPNVFDKANGRSGSYILMHGGCSSVGCFAMTDPVMREIYGLAQSAIRKGQRHIPIHVFPFRMSDENLARHEGSPWSQFWASLKKGYDSFERTRRPPRISVCKGEYWVEDMPATAPTTAAPAPTRDRARRDILIGAVRSACPEPVIATADPNAQAPETAAAR